MTIKINLSGKTFGRLTVVSFEGEGNNGDRLWKCQCSCGVVKLVAGGKLRGGKTRSCGCLHRDGLIARNKAGAAAGVRA